MLEVEDLHVAYGASEVLHGISFTVAAGEIVALVGANGAGKSTTLRTISGLMRPKRGTIRFEGAAIVGVAVETIVQRGLAHCPEGRRIFPGLTVAENLRVGTAGRPRGSDAGEDLDLVYTLFRVSPNGGVRGGWSLSGGEQQMLAIGRALMGRPKLLMLDEPSLGLAPIIIEGLFDRIVELNRRTGLAILLVEQNAALALDVAHRAFVLETGTITLAGEAALLAQDPRVRQAYLGG